MRLTLSSFWHFVFLMMCASAPAVAAQPAEIPTNWRIERLALDREFADRLEAIASWCREQSIPQQIPETFKIYRPRDLQRQYIFIPSEQTMPKPPEGILGQWLNKINEVKIWQAERLFELAKREALADASGPAFQLLNEVLYFNKDHAEVRRILGHRKTDESWRVAPDRIKVGVANRPHDLCRWPAKSYLNVTTPHFDIESNAGEQETIYLAEKLERWHGVWRQVFFDYWCSPKNLQRWIDGKSSYRHSKKKFRVVFFQHRADYVTQLGRSVRGVEVSTGYYSSDQNVSFFYDDSDRIVEDTWRHELTHQLFRESINTGDDLFEDEFIWLDEGIATYFESLTDFGDFVTLGGFETRRLQYARIRLLLEGFYVPLQELSALGRKNLQSRADMVRIYSQVAGMTDMLMNDQDGAFESLTCEFLQNLYKGRKIRSGTFEELLGQTYAELDQRYQRYLQVDSQRVVEHLSMPLSRTELSFAGSTLTDAAYPAIGRCHNLTWLDLSKNPISAKQLGQLKECQKLTQVFLTACPIERGAIAQLAELPTLDELDLSASSVSDAQMSELKKLPALTSLKLVSTRITDAGLMHLAGLPKLKFLDVSRTQITAGGIARLKQQLPQLIVTQ